MSIEMQYYHKQRGERTGQLSARGINSDNINFMKNAFCPSVGQLHRLRLVSERLIASSESSIFSNEDVKYADIIQVSGA